jgi:hypothetical protein
MLAWTGPVAVDLQRRVIWAFQRKRRAAARNGATAAVLSEADVACETIQA